MTEDKTEVSTESVGISGYVGPDPSHKNRNKRRDALRRGLWSARPDGPVLFMLRTEMIKDNLSKTASTSQRSYIRVKDGHMRNGYKDETTSHGELVS